MSIIKNKKVYIFILLMFCAVFIFGCNNIVHVENIHFQENEIVLLVGETYSPNVAINPSHATNRGYTIISNDSSIVTVNDNQLTAVKEGLTTIRVVSHDNELKEDLISVTVRKTTTTLNTPRDFVYDETSQAFVFSSVENASGYTIKINGNEINLGNSNTYSLSQYNIEYGNAYDTVLNVQVRADAPSYSQAFISSAYTEELSIYQNSPVTSASIVGGVLNFDRVDGSTTYDLRIDGESWKQVSTNRVELLDLDERYIGQNVTLGIVALVNQSYQTDDDVTYYASSSFDIQVSVLDVAYITFSSSTLVWNDVPNVNNYIINIDDEQVATTLNNYFDLYSLENINEYTYRDGGYNIEVIPVLDPNSKNVVKTTANSNIVNFNRVETPILSAANNLISWQNVDNSTGYLITLNFGDQQFTTTIQNNTFSLENYPSNTQYTLTVQVLGYQNLSENYIASLPSEITITKQNEPELNINDYNLVFSAQEGDRYSIEVDLGEEDNIVETVLAESDSISFALREYDFVAGEHTVTVVHLGDSETVFDSGESTITFTQLAPIDTITIDSGIASVNIDEVNQNANIKFVVSNTDVVYEVESSEHTFNTLDSLQENYLAAGSYTISVYVCGDGSATFSYRIDGVETASSTASFVVLQAPTAYIMDKTSSVLAYNAIESAENYNIYQYVDGAFTLVEQEKSTEYEFSLLSGETRFAVQAVGNGSTTLDSAYSQDITVVRLQTPTLAYDNTTDIISKTDPNSPEIVEGYRFTFNGEENDYTFDTAFVGFENSNVFTLQALAVDNQMNTYYLNSFEDTLEINMIDNTISLLLNSSNQLVITPLNHEEQYTLQLMFTIGEEELLFNDESGQLVYEDIVLPYVYEEGSYYIDLLNPNFTPIIESMTQDFMVKVKFIIPSTGEDDTANSAFTDDYEVTILQKSTLSREDNFIVFTNVEAVRTSQDYALLINDEFYLELDSSTQNDTDNQRLRVAVDYIYNNVPSEYLEEINSVAVITLNTDSVESNLTLSVVSEELLFTRAQQIELTSSKDNNSANNSVVISFAVSQVDYDVEYVVEIYNKEEDNKTNLVTQRYQDVIDSTISFNLDDFELVGDIYISAYVVANAEFNQELDTIYVFSSSASNELMFTKIDTVSNISVSNGILTFSPVANAVGYEVYKRVADGFEKINTSLLTSLTYDLSSESGHLEIAIKSISFDNGYTNSNLSETINVNKLATPVVSIENGNIVLSVSADVVTLLQNAEVNCSIIIINGTREVSLNLDSEGVSLSGTRITIEPYMVLNYGTSALIRENLSISIRVEYEDTENSVYYMNSNSASIEVYGLFSPTNISKYSSNVDAAEYVEHISWTGNANNILNSEDLTYGYIFKLEIGSGEDIVTYYSTDSNLKYLDQSIGAEHYSYSSTIIDNNIIFPYGYDENEDGTIDEGEIFGPNTYTIYVKEVPKTISGYNLCSSAYSTGYTITIMSTPVLVADQGRIVWMADDNATSYIVRVYANDFETEIALDTVTTYEFDFSNDEFADMYGIYGVSVQAISSNRNILNSQISEIMQVYRMPEVETVTIDDGSLILYANQYFSGAEIELVDTEGGRIEQLLYSRDEDAETALAEIESWQNEVEAGREAQLSTSHRFIVEILDNEILNIMSGRNYTINVRLIGNSNSSLCIVNSRKSIGTSELNTIKLKDALFEVQTGILQFGYEEEYDSSNFNYQFNGQENLSTNSFWNNTVVYKLNITTSSSSYDIYAVDYYSFMAAIDSSVLSSADYVLFSGEMNGLYAYVRYAYTDEQETKYLYFNVFENNYINLRDYDSLYYYPINVVKEDGEFVYTGVDADNGFTTVDIAAGGSFVVRASVLGGDSVIQTESASSVIISQSGYLTSNINSSNTFIRYGDNILSSSNGMIRLENQSPTNEYDIVLDYPVYKLSITPLNTQDTTVVYLYYTNEEEARLITGDADGYYVQVTYDETNGDILLFDFSNYLDSNGEYVFNPGTYNIQVQTLAGFGTSGNEDDANYLLNSKQPTRTYPFRKISNTTITSGSGVLEFNLGTVQGTNQTIYIYDYEITLQDVSTGQEYVYTINRDSEGVTVDSVNHRITYEIPASIEVDGEIIEINNAGEYTIKVKAIATDSNQYVLNGAYAKTNGSDVTLTFVKSRGIEDNSVMVDNGVLRWRVADLSNYSTVNIVLTYQDENNQDVRILINTNGTAYYNDSSVYQYHYYRFADSRYTILGTNTLVYIDSGIDYSVEIYVVGNSTSGTAILNSNPTEPIIMNRVQRVDDSTITSFDGKLTWEAVDGASSYEVVLTSGDNVYTFSTDETTIDFETTTADDGQRIIAGDYTIEIRALGDTMITARNTVSTHTFTKLATVTNIRIDETNPGSMTWDIVDGAQGYKVTFNYNNSAGTPLYTEEQLEGEDNNSCEAPTGMTGQYSVTVQAVGIGYGYVFNGESATFESSKDRPNPVGAVMFDDTNYRYYWQTASDFGETDVLRITYNFSPYIRTEAGNIVLSSSETMVTVNISYNQTGSYFMQDGVKYYYYAPTEMGMIRDFTVQVEREGSMYSDASSGDDLDFNLFSYGAGTEDNPYRLDSATELLNISLFNSAYYELIAAIDLSSSNLAGRLQANGYIICDSFYGQIDGGGYSIHGLNSISLNGVSSLALFNNINGATIKNLIIGASAEETIITNTFANNTQDVIELGLIAINSTNSTIEDLTIYNLTFIIAGSGTLQNEVYVGGLFANTTSTTISGLLANVDIQFNANSTAVSYIGGAVANAESTTINSSSSRASQIEFSMSQGVTNIRFNYIGGAVGYMDGEDMRTSGVYDATVEMNITNIYSSYIGGIVGFANKITIDGSETSGSITHQGLNVNTYMGGIVGTGQSVIINDSQVNLEFNIQIANASSSIYIGALAGALRTANTGNVDCQVTNCGIGYAFVEQTILNQTGIDQIGIYGTSTQTNITVSGCYEI